jgi:Ca2+-binding EF-hand superfamily protein
MKLTPVKSSMLRAVGYDRKTNEMEVVFRTGDAYRYENVPLSIYSDLLKAKSKGTYMQEHIINVFPYYRLK